MSELNRNAAINSMDALLASTLDDLDDLPSFETPTPGVYICTVSTEQKTINDKDAIEAKFVIKETVETADPTAMAPVAGSTFSTLFTLNEFGIGKLKEFCKPFGAHFSTNSIGELVREHIKDVTVSVLVGNRKDKTDPEKVYATTKILSIV